MCMGKNMKTIHTVKEFNEICQNNGIQVFLFTTKWCGDCIYIKPFLPSIEKQFGQGAIMRLGDKADVWNWLKKWALWGFRVLSVIKMEKKYHDLFQVYVKPKKKLLLI